MESDIKVQINRLNGALDALGLVQGKTVDASPLLTAKEQEEIIRRLYSPELKIAVR